MGIGTLRQYHNPPEPDPQPQPAAESEPAAPNTAPSITDIGLKDLPDHLKTVTSPEELKALADSDPRKGAVEIYAARMAELAEAKTESTPLAPAGESTEPPPPPAGEGTTPPAE